MRFRTFKDLRINAKFYFKGVEYTKVGEAHKKDNNTIVTYIMCTEEVAVSDRIVRAQSNIYAKVFK